MTNLPMFPERSSGDDDTPLPLLVAKKWDFPLAFHIVEGQYYYAVQDWVRGLFGEEDIRHIWAKFKKQNPEFGTLSSGSRMAYKTSNGRTHMRDFVTAKGLYLLTQNLRAMTSRPALKEIREFLAKAGVLVDEMRRDEDLIVISSKMSPDQMLAAKERAEDAIRAAYRREGKSETWIEARMQSRIKRNRFTAALTQAILETLNPSHYAIATNDIYEGLWQRTAAILKRELSLPKHANLRDHQPQMALHFQGIVEEAVAHELGEKEEVTWAEARDIVQTMAAMVRPWTEQMRDRLKIDIATGRPLLKHG